MIYLSNQLKWHHLSDYIPEYVIEGFYLGIGAFFLFGYSDYAFGITDAHSNRGVRVYPNLISMYYHYIQRGSLWYLVASLSVFGFLQLGRRLSKPFPWVILTTCIGLALGVLYPTERCLKYVYGEVGVDFEFL
jgi:sulfate permease, SulP family